MKNSTVHNNFKKAAALLSAAVMIAVLLFAFAACDETLKAEPVSVTLIIGDKTLTTETREEKVVGLLTELKKAGKISAFEYTGQKWGAFVTEIDALKGDSTQGTYILLYHDIDDSGLHEFGSEGVIKREIDGKSYFFSGVGVSLLPVEDGATYVFVLES
ncbi:MAG: hypothetical protein LBC13_03475 [Clostridiales bacterium]|jgi:hypothetical protein|nr:hypothetical protein [Clostridiales bacterium]